MPETSREITERGRKIHDTMFKLYQTVDRALTLNPDLHFQMNEADHVCLEYFAEKPLTTFLNVTIKTNIELEPGRVLIRLE